MIPKSHRLAIEHRPEPAPVLVLSCCDGRFIDAVEQFLTDIGEPLHDLVAYPGGPANLPSLTAGFLEQQAVSESLDFMIKAHRTRLLLLIAHHDCAYYLRRYGASDRARQEQDLRAAAEEIRSRHGSVQVAMCYLQPLPAEDGGGVVVERVEDEARRGS